MFKRLQTVAGSCLAFSVLLGLAAPYSQAQAAAAQAQRQVELHIANNSEAVVVTRITLGDVVVQQGRFIKPRGTAPDPVTPFLADDDWVQNLTVYLLNRTMRTIVYASFNISFPETTDRTTDPPFRAIFLLNLGRIPPSVFVDSKGMPARSRQDRAPLLLRPGREIAIHLGDYIDQIKAEVERVRPLAALTTMYVNLTRLYFADGMRGGLGGFAVYDRQNNTWQRMDPDYFPGNMHSNWPGRPGWFEHDHPIKEEKR
jgi:hypothetical protein